MINTLSRKFSFSSAHFMRGFEGKCSKMHGHNYNGVITLKGKVNEHGYIFCSNLLKEFISQIEEVYDHSILNNLDEYQQINPSMENIAIDIYKKLKTVIPLELRVDIHETDKNSATCGDFI